MFGHSWKSLALMAVMGAIGTAIAKRTPAAKWLGL